MIAHRFFLAIMTASIDSSFPRHYEYELLDELPGEATPRHWFPPTPGGQDGLTLRVMPYSATAWVGTFAFGQFPNGISCILSMPNENQLCVVARGHGYLVLSNDPCVWEQINVTPVIDVRSL
ncbi:MAG TPA: hypothetical protein VFZ25_01230, partial [Chloroflexota bacterium]|nr:hypothetical protein [Chloroflexota bacterium]